MRVYHGSNMVVNVPKIIKANRTLDFENRFMDIESAIRELRTYKLADQISFHTEEAIRLLKFIGKEVV